MKRKTIAFIAILLLLIVALAIAQDVTVYITRTGAKYHVGTCRYLSRSKIPISLSAAIARGYTPCSVCRPPVLSSKSKEQLIPLKTIEEPKPVQGASTQALYQVNTVNFSSYRYADLGHLLPAKVVDHVDGDTVKIFILNPPQNLGFLETIRMIGVDTPETVHPQKPVE